MGTKKTFADYGLTLTQKINSDNLISTNFSVANKVTEGLKVDLDTTFAPVTGKMAGNNISFSYIADDFVLHSAIIDASKYVGSVHHQVNDKLGAAVNLDWTAGSSTSSFSVCGKYSLDADTHVKAKIDNNLRCGVSYLQKLRDGVSLTLSGLVNAKSLEEGGHKLGLSLNFDA